MTLPHERTRSLIQAGELLQELSKDTGLAETIRKQATAVLRHYPSKEEVVQIGKRDEMADNVFGPLLSSDIEYR